jgi:photosystem II stability/assembly factor-like uncharacterized protein
MKYLRALGLALPAVLALAVLSVANVSTNSTASTARLADWECNTHYNGSTYNYILNCNTIGLGVIHVKDNNYTHGTYDAVLDGYAGTTDVLFGWQSVAGWYLGAGYCSSQYRSDDGGRTWKRQTPDLGPGQHFIGDTDYQVVMYHC